MTKRSYKVFVSVNVMGTISVDARDEDDAKKIVNGMAGSSVIDSMRADDYDVCADDAEENFDEEE